MKNIIIVFNCNAAENKIEQNLYTLIVDYVILFNIF